LVKNGELTLTKNIKRPSKDRKDHQTKHGSGGFKKVFSNSPNGAMVATVDS
jgi:hypothetical protein